MISFHLKKQTINYKRKCNLFFFLYLLFKTFEKVRLPRCILIWSKSRVKISPHLRFFSLFYTTTVLTFDLLDVYFLPLKLCQYTLVVFNGTIVHYLEGIWKILYLTFAEYIATRYIKIYSHQKQPIHYAVRIFRFRSTSFWQV